ncbi:MAG: Rmf/CrpP family protein [Pseudomonadota bacterium]
MGVYQTKAQVHAFERGFQAYRKGKSPSDNPYPREADYFACWMQGYAKAENQGRDTEQRSQSRL